MADTPYSGGHKVSYACLFLFFILLSSPYSLTYVLNTGVPRIEARSVIGEIIACCGLCPDRNEFHQEILELTLIFFEASRDEVERCLQYAITRRSFPARGGRCFFSAYQSFFAALALSWKFLLGEVGLDDGVIEELAGRIHTPVPKVADWVEGVQDLLGEDNLQALRELASVPSYLRD